MATRPVNGGIMSLSELCDGLRKVRARSGGQTISHEDVKRAIQKLAVLGGGYRVVLLGGQRYVMSVPSELSPDSTMVLQACAAQHQHFVTVPWLTANLRWDESRARSACQTLLTDGLAWQDGQATGSGDDSRVRYYFQALWVAGSEGGGDAARATPTAAASPLVRVAAAATSASTSSLVADGVLRDDADD
jgi:ESCRT-II complex subunit VPS22